MARAEPPVNGLLRDLLVRALPEYRLNDPDAPGDDVHREHADEVKGDPGNDERDECAHKANGE